MPPRINTLSGTDFVAYVPGTNTPPAHRFTGTLSGPDVLSLSGAASGAGSSGISGIHATGTGGDIGHAIGIPCNSTIDPDFDFYGSMSEDMLHRYLDRCIAVENLSSFSGPMQDPAYDALNTSISRAQNIAYLTDPAYDHGKLSHMIVDVGAKFVELMGGAYDFQSDRDVNIICNMLRDDIDFIHCYDSQIICGGYFSEFTNAGIANVTIPTLTPIGASSPVPDLETIGLFYPGPLAAARWAESQYFIIERMVMKPVTCISGGNYWAPDCDVDLKQPEAQMWYYYSAVRLIDAGCESIHFGDLFSYAGKSPDPPRDPGFPNLWYLCQQIRAYAAAHARRGVVLLTTHTTFDQIANWYYDPPGAPIQPDFVRQLIFDFHTLGTYYEYMGPDKCSDGIGTASYPMQLVEGTNYINGLTSMIGISPGGLNPLGWYCTHNPFLLRYDNGANSSEFPFGCLHPNPDSQGYYGYGLENTSWFVFQRVDLRQLILIYTYYRIKCLDQYTHFCMPGRLIYHIPDAAIAGGWSYDQYYNGFSEAATIKNLWNGLYAGHHDWSPYDFTNENVPGADSGYDVSSCLIFVGTDKMFYISTDGYIHGYIKVDGDFNGGRWLTVSPSYAASMEHGAYDVTQLIGNQVKAQSDLVASPDGQWLYYIGVDSYIHSFQIFDPWTYYYTDFMKEAMSAQGIKAVGSLIYPFSDRIYYIATYFNSDGTPSFNDTDRVHGFQKLSGTWQTVSPTYAAVYAGQSLDAQSKASGSLTYITRADHDRIYYRNIYGLISYYEVLDTSLVNYYYMECPGNWNLHDVVLRIVGNLVFNSNRIYFVAKNNDGAYWIYCLIDNGTAWDLLNVSSNAATYAGPSLDSQLQSALAGNIAVSPDGNTIVYFPNAFPWPCCYHNIDGTNYKYEEFYNQVSQSQNWTENGNSLQFIGNNEFFLVSSYYNNIVHFLYEECYCNNNVLRNWWPDLPPLIVYPSVEVILYLGHFYLRLTCSGCGILDCYEWNFSYRQPSTSTAEGDFGGSVTFTVPCPSSYTHDIEIHPNMHGIRYYEYYITNLSCSDIPIINNGIIIF